MQIGEKLGARGQKGACRTVFSFVIDDDGRHAYNGWHLARSLVERCGGDPSAVHVQCTPGASERTRDRFRDCNYQIHEIPRFGDQRHCNKLSQLESLQDADFDRVILLDTDTIAVGDIRPFLDEQAVSGVPVALTRPSLATLQEIAAASGLQKLPAVCQTDVSAEETYLANCNGGLYSVPKAYCATLSREWRRWALWLLDNLEPLRRVGRTANVDQVSFCLAVHHAALPFVIAPSNANYNVNLGGPHHYLDETREIVLVHYHSEWNLIGLITIPADRPQREHDAIAKANEQIKRGYDNELFWQLRYRVFPERGSGVGSRGENLSYKRKLLIEQGIEASKSVLDVGCGDLQVLKELSISRYSGLDISPAAIEIARAARPDWDFRVAPAPEVLPAEMVLCFEVLIHQSTFEAYRALIAFLATKALRSLIVSGFSQGSEAVEQNPITFFYEPLEDSLRRLGRFRNIQPIGSHTSVVIYRCDD